MTLRSALLLWGGKARHDFRILDEVFRSQFQLYGVDDGGDQQVGLLIKMPTLSHLRWDWLIDQQFKQT